MKVINPNDFFDYYLTVDSTLITVDSTEITVDTVSIETGDLALQIKPKYFVEEVDLSFFNEITKETHTERCFTYNRKSWMHIPFTFKDFKEGDEFWCTARRTDGRWIWGDKVLVTYQEDLENYKLNIPNTNGKIRI